MREARWAGIGLLVLFASLTAFGGTATAQPDACRVGQELDPGDYCTVDIPGINVGTNRFVVTSDGRGCYGGICAGGGLNLNGFEASRISGTSRWRIDAVPGGGTTNRPPRATGSVPAQTLTVGGGSTSVNVARYFTDPDGDRLTYTARSSRTGVVRASVSGSSVTLAPVAAGTATVTVTARDPDGASATQSIAVTVEEDGGTNQPPRAIGSIPAQTLTVGGGSTSVNVARYFTDPDGDRLTYTARSSRTGVVRATVSGSTVTLAPVAAGTTAVVVTARDPNGASATQAIAVTVRAPGGGGGRLPDLDIDLDEVASPRGIWSDGATMWVADRVDNKLYAYVLATGARDGDKDIDTLRAAGNNRPRGIWSDGATIWVADWTHDKLYAYVLATGARDGDKDIDTLDAVGNTSPEGIWSDGATMWVADGVDDKLYAYVLATGARDGDKDIDTLDAVGNTRPEGIWSDGATMWVADWMDRKLYAYVLATGARDRDKDFDTLVAAGNTTVSGIWSDGATMWVADWSDNKLYAYALPRDGGGTNRPPRSVGSIPAQTLNVGSTAPVNVTRYFTDPDGDPLTYTARSSRIGIVTAAVSGGSVTLTPVAVGTATVSVIARDPGGESATQAISVTVQPGGGVNGFTDDPLVPAVTPVRTVHFRELRTRIDALRTTGGLSAYAWTDPALTPGVTRVRSAHLTGCGPH